LDINLLEIKFWSRNQLILPSWTLSHSTLAFNNFQIHSWEASISYLAPTIHQ